MADLRDSASCTPPPPNPHLALSDNRRRYSRLSKINKERKKEMGGGNAAPPPPPLYSLRPPPGPPWSMGVNHGLALAQIGNKYLRTCKTITSGRRRKWIPSPRSPSPGRRGPAMGSNYRWMPADRPIPPARVVGPGPRAFSRQIASSALESNLLPAHRQTDDVRQADGCLCWPGQCGRMNGNVGWWQGRGGSLDSGGGRQR